VRASLDNSFTFVIICFLFFFIISQEDAWNGGPAFAFYCKREVGDEPTEQETFATLDSLLGSEL